MKGSYRKELCHEKWCLGLFDPYISHGRRVKKSDKKFLSKLLRTRLRRELNNGRNDYKKYTD